MKIWITALAAMFSISAHALVISADPKDVTCKAEVNSFNVVLFDIQIRAKTVGQWIVANNEPVDCPEANAAIAYCESIIQKASQAGKDVVVDTDSNDVQRAITVAHGGQCSSM